MSEHRAVIAALAAGDAKRATALMDEHLEAVASRALIVARPNRAKEFKDVLALYADEAKPAMSRKRARQ